MCNPLTYILLIICLGFPFVRIFWLLHGLCWKLSVNKNPSKTCCHHKWLQKALVHWHDHVRIDMPFWYQFRERLLCGGLCFMSKCSQWSSRAQQHAQTTLTLVQNTQANISGNGNCILGNVCVVHLPGAHAGLCAHDQMCLRLGVECGT